MMSLSAKVLVRGPFFAAPEGLRRAKRMYRDLSLHLLSAKVQEVLDVKNVRHQLQMHCAVT